MATKLEIIERYVNLEQSNSDFYRGLCPFHTDQNPSFWCHTDGYWGCFACSDTGQFIDFISRIHGCSSLSEAELILEDLDVDNSSIPIDDEIREFIEVCSKFCKNTEDVMTAIEKYENFESSDDFEAINLLGQGFQTLKNPVLASRPEHLSFNHLDPANPILNTVVLSSLNFKKTLLTALEIRIRRTNELG